MALRLTERQYAVLKNPSKKAAARGSKPCSALSEKDVTKQITDYLQAHGWTVTRQQSGLFTRPGAERSDGGAMIRIGEKGVADWRAERPVSVPHAFGIPGAWSRSLHELFYLEFKSPGKKPRPEQLAWLERRRLTGTTAEWFDSFDDDGFNDGHAFLPWYQARFT